MYQINVDEEGSVLRNLLLPLTMVFVVITILVASALYVTHKKALTEFSVNTIQGVQAELDKGIEEKVSVLLTLEKVFTTTPQLIDALKQSDRQRLITMYQDYYQQLNERLSVTHFYFHQPDLVNLVRLHQPSRYGDTITRMTAIEAKSRAKPVWGMELGLLGTYTLRVVMPVIDESDVIGFVELGIEIEDLTSGIFDNHVTHLDWAITIKKAQLDKSMWQEGMNLLGRDDNWETFPDIVWVSSSLKQIPASWHKLIHEETTNTINTSLPSEDDKTWHFSALELKDMKGSHIGNLLAFIDVTEQERQHLRDYRNFLFPLIGLMLFLLIVLFYALRRVDERIYQHQNQLFDLAHTDTLTGLPNRQLLGDRLTQAMNGAKRRKSRVAVVFLDLDNFKHINDSYGHSVGDQLLQSVAERVKQSLRQEDTIVRQGGDEFVLILENIKDNRALSRVAEKLLQAFDHPFKLAQVEVTITTSIGISLYPDDGENTEVLLRNADSAMYQAKEKGRNNFEYYSKGLTSTVLERVTIETNLRQALKAKDELYLCYQPQYNLQTQKIVGFEALARWKTSNGEHISPGDFIPVAEQSGLIYQIGEWALLAACQQAKIWLDRGLDFQRISVNVSGVQLQRNSLVTHVQQVLKQTELPAKYLELEVTESALMHNMELSIQHLEQIKAMGVYISIDDFGTGYSSLAYLKKLPIQKLKIDRSFVDGIPQDSHDLSIVTAIISMAKGLDLEVIAEGVETLSQIEALIALDCHTGQGYYYSKPQEPAYIEQHILN